MALDVSAYFGEAERLAQSAPTPLARGLEGSAILAIAAHVRRLVAEGHEVSNFTIGDFKELLRKQGAQLGISLFDTVVLLDWEKFQPLVKAALGDGAAKCVLRKIAY